MPSLFGFQECTVRSVSSEIKSFYPFFLPGAPGEVCKPQTLSVAE